MNFRAISVAIVLAGLAGTAVAAGQGRTMQSVTVTGTPVSACTPPNDSSRHACDAYNQMLRANFSAREIGMLFGYQTAYPESLAGGVDRLQHRYQVVLQEFVAAQQRAEEARVAAK